MKILFHALAISASANALIPTPLSPRPRVLRTARHAISISSVGGSEHSAWKLPLGSSNALKLFVESSKQFLLSRISDPAKINVNNSSSTQLDHSVPSDSSDLTTKPKRNDWSRLRELAFADAGILYVSAFSLVGAALCDVALPRYSAAALSSIIAGNSASFGEAISGLLLASGGSALFTGLRGGFFWVAGARVVARLRLKLFSSLMKQDIGFFDANDTGQLTSRLSADCAKLANVVSFHVNIIVRQSIAAFGGMCYLFWLNGKMAAATLGGLLLMSVVSWANGAFSRWLAAKATDELAAANGCAEQSLGLIRLVRSHAAERRETARYGNKLSSILAIQEVQGVAYGLSRVAASVAQTVVTVSVLLTGCRAVASGVMTGADLTAFMFYVAFVSSSSFDVGEQWTRIQEALGAGDTVFSLAERKPQRTAEGTKEGAADAAGSVAEGSSQLQAHSISEPGSLVTKKTEKEEGSAPMSESSYTPLNARDGASKAVRSPTTHKAAADSLERSSKASNSASRDAKLILEDVEFNYPTRPDAKVLKGLNLKVREGEVIGLIGGSGGGKSTIIRLLCGFYAPTKGKVLLKSNFRGSGNNHQRLGDVVLDYTPEQIASKIAWVTQEPQLFPISIAENIAYGLPSGSWTMSEVEAAARAANVHDFAKSLPDGYDTLVGEWGGALSGGQRQRIAIARALMRDPEVLLLDEPTSALDAESEELVASALSNAFQGRTVVIVAHRLATIQSADRVVVLSDGRVLEDGPPSELGKRQDSAYAALLQKQALVLP